MAEENLTSPPYPSQVTTVAGLYRCLDALRDWVIDQQKDLRYCMTALVEAEQQAGNENVAEAVSKSLSRIEETPEMIPTVSIWENISVCDHYFALTHLRNIREGWDHLLREHEDTWDSKLSLHKRFTLLVAAQHVLVEAFVAPEVREMHDEQAMADYTRKRRALEKHLRDVLVPQELKDEENADESAEDEEDDWFG